MSRAEERAFERCPKSENMIEEMRNARRRVIFIEGYHQAEKDLTDKAKVSNGWDGFYYGQGYKQAERDLELTYDDICEIMEIREDVLEMDSYENLYEEILKRFKERKIYENNK